ncbi:hypothetical protein BDB01DRAFT_770730 [Pilobolus umbonatus]|nr:hypothetical protein BDB01DRAFT_770730 [Pilobolus umbonatus]
MSQIRLYDLELDIPKQVWSPNTCKTRYALNVKGILYETEWVTFSTLQSIIPPITKTGVRPTVPIIVDLAHDNKVIQDSWDIAVYLDKTFPDTPSLFHGNIGVHQFFHEYVTSTAHVLVFQLCVLDIYSRCSSEVKSSFRQTREKILGMPLEQFAGDPAKTMKTLQKSLVSIKKVLDSHPFITGDKVGWADVSLASSLTPLSVFKPEMFKSLIDGNSLGQWWWRMRKYTSTDISPRL